MAEIKHTLIGSYLGSLTQDTAPQLFFIWGEEYICRKVFDSVIEFLLPGNLKEFGYELLEGDDATISSIVERLCTYSFFQEKVVVAVKNFPLFQPGAKESADADQRGDADALSRLIEKGFPENHYLVITSGSADRRRAVFNSMKTSGTVIDCTVPQGSGKAEKEEQSDLLRITMKDVLDATGKGIDGDAFQYLTELTGFDPVALNDNLERLTAFIGSRDRITLGDVRAVVKRTRKDAIFELTNAIADKNLGAALFYCKSLTDSGFHPLQLLASLVNLIRKLVVVKSFVESEASKGNICWRPGAQSYQQFSTATMPFVVKADSAHMEMLQGWEEELAGENGVHGNGDANAGKESLASSGKRSRKKGGSDKKRAGDLIMASSSKSAYPVYQTFLKSDNYSLQELVYLMMELGEMDYRFKSSSDGNEMILLEELIIRICTNAIRNGD